MNARRLDDYVQYCERLLDKQPNSLFLCNSLLLARDHKDYREAQQERDDLQAALDTLTLAFMALYLDQQHTIDRYKHKRKRAMQATALAFIGLTSLIVSVTGLLVLLIAHGG